MKILYFSRDYTNHDHRWLQAISDAGHQVAFLRLERFGSNLDERPLPAGVRELEWAGGRQPFDWRMGDSLGIELNALLAAEQPDILQAGPLTTAGVLAARSGFRPLVQMSWGYDLLWEAQRSKQDRFRAQFALSVADAMIGDCETVRRAAVALGMADDRIVAFPWGIDIERFAPGDGSGLREELGWEDAFVLLHTRNWEAVYGALTVAEGFALAAQEVDALRLIMMGGGSQENELRAIFERYGVSERVHFTGQIAQAELADYFRTADLYLSGSHSDGSSVSLMESLASGTPALVSDIPGNREWVQEGREGWLFPLDDAKALAAQIVQAYAHREGLKEMGRKGREHAEQRADWRVNQLGIREAYELALKVRA